MIFRRLLVASLVLASTAAMADNDAISISIGVEMNRVQATEKAAGNYRGFETLFPANTKLLEVREEDGAYRLVFNQWLSAARWDKEGIEDLTETIRSAAGEDIPSGAPIEVLVRFEENDKPTLDVPLSELIPTSDRVRSREEAREIPAPELAAPVVARPDYAGPERGAGLMGRNIVLGPSHGYIWHKENRWQFQRARVYTIIEDLLPQSYVNPFLEPMLENAGANTWNVRERDYQTAEVIVDNDDTSRYSSFSTTGDWSDSGAAGWNGGRPTVLDDTTEPFTLGTTVRALVTDADNKSSSTAVYTPYIPRQGRYGVYASWTMDDANSASVPVEVRHAGGLTHLRVNQQVAGGVWVFLGFFEFDQGADFEKGSVTISGGGATPNGDSPTYISADAVRFGGGMGNVAPMGEISRKPRYAEGSRYWLQYTGAPAESVFHLDFDASNHHFGLDYIRDFSVRAEWPNYLQGAPAGPNFDRSLPGLGVPVDLFLAWHTDAGHDREGLIGTLSLWRLYDTEGNMHFPDGRSRLMNRDLTALMQDEIMRTGRELYSSTWRQRAVQQRNLAETRRPNVPSTLLELFSHHNFNDMKYGLDPRFKRDMSRAIYKSILRFVAYSNGYDPVVLPLEPVKLACVSNGDATATLFWQPQVDPLEPSAKADGYIVYTSDDGRAFDNGVYTTEITRTVTELESGEARYFRVTAANAGGESFPSRTVGVRWVEDAEPILIVDGFDRISGPEIVVEDYTEGFDRKADQGIGYMYNYGVVGDQYDFDPESAWVNDLESPGMGGSQSAVEDNLELGNTFDHIVRHGQALDGAVGFDSTTADAYAEFGSGADYRLIDWIAGRQRTVMPYDGEWKNGAPDMMKADFQVLTADARQALRGHLDAGGALVISGAHLGEDLMDGGLADEASRAFAAEVLGMESYTAGATSTNSVGPAEDAAAAIGPFRFGHDLDAEFNLLPTVYNVNSAEGYETAGDPILKYGDTGEVAGYHFGRVIVIGLPIETILPPERREEVLNTAIGKLR